MSKVNALPTQPFASRTSKSHRHTARTRHRLVERALWTCLFSLALLDVVVSYFATTFAIPLLTRPWVLITGLFIIAALVDSKALVRLPQIFSFAFLILLFSLFVGTFTAENSKSFFQPNLSSGLTIKSLTTMLVAFLIGAAWAAEARRTAEQIASVLVAVTGIHALVCLLAITGFSADFFPVVDSPYYKDGKLISRPEITTDQTRQVLYLFAGTTALFLSRNAIKILISLFVIVGIAITVAHVQSRWSTVLFSAFLVWIYLAAIYLRRQRYAVIYGSIFLWMVLAAIFHTQLLHAASNLIWRFTEMDSSYGGRLTAVNYLFEKLLDVSYWIPRGDQDFAKTFGALPHSFPTMIYLNGGLFGLVSYLIAIFVPLALLFRDFFRKKITAIGLTALSCGGFSLAMQLTQPVVSHEIFWLMAGLVIGSLRHRPTLPRSLQSRSPGSIRQHTAEA